MHIEYAGESWQLLAQRSMLRVAQRQLVVADAHFGKAAAFRARGVPVPSGTTLENLARLSQLIDATGARAIVFLGDLFHARESHAPDTLAQWRAWRARHAALDLILVEGNHDRAAGAVPADLAVREVVAPWRDGALAFCHEPRRIDGAYVLAGHQHPCVRLYGAAGDTVRLPCFWLRDRLAVLPAFGEFTGGAQIAREPGDRVIAVAEETLIEIPGATVSA